MPDTIVLETALTADEIFAVAVGARLELGETAQGRIVAARAIVEALVDQGIRGYGINTGVGALKCTAEAVQSMNSAPASTATRGTPAGSTLDLYAVG